MFLSKYTSNHFFILSIAIFFLAKIFLVTSVSLAIGIPRLGDDSMIYLWKSKIFLSDEAYSYSSLKDIRAQRFLKDHPSDDLAFSRSNIAQRTLQETFSPTYNLLTSPIIYFANDMRLAFAYTEVIGLLLMIAGIAWLFFEIVGPLAGGIGLLLVSFAILPNQGINSFIPSTYALACSFILWAYIWRKGRDVSWKVIFIVAMLILGLHPIGKVYMFITPFFLGIRLGTTRCYKFPIFWKTLFACCGSLTLTLAFPYLSPHLTPPPSDILGGLNFSTGIKTNALAIISLIWDPIIRFNPAWSLLFFGTIILWGKKSFSNQLGLLLWGVFLLLVISLLFFLPGYPGELFSRIWVLFFVITSAICGKFYERILTNQQGISKAYCYAFWITITVSSITWVHKYTPTTMNWRNEVLYEKKIKTTFSHLPENTSVLYTESNIALQASLMLGGEKLGAVVYPMLKHSDSLEKIIAEKRPRTIVTPIDYRLNNLAEVRSKKFTVRRLGIFFPANERFTIYRDNGAPLKKIWLKFYSDKYQEFNLKINFFEYGNKLPIKKILPAKTTISEIEVPNNIAYIEIECPDLPIWLTGFGSGTPHEQINWPWQESWAIKYQPKNNKKAVTISFNITALLEQVSATEILPLVNKSNPVISDDGGLVFLRSKYWE
jgi:hypothetical protein